MCTSYTTTSSCSLSQVLITVSSVAMNLTTLGFTWVELLHSVCLCLAYFTQRNIFEVHLYYVSEFPSLLKAGIILHYYWLYAHVYTVFCLSTSSLVCLFVSFTFWRVYVPFSPSADILKNINSILDFMVNHHIVFLGGTILRFHEQSKRVPMSPHPCSFSLRLPNDHDVGNFCFCCSSLSIFFRKISIQVLCHIFNTIYTFLLLCAFYILFELPQ